MPGLPGPPTIRRHNESTVIHQSSIAKNMWRTEVENERSKVIRITWSVLRWRLEQGNLNFSSASVRVLQWKLPNHYVSIQNSNHKIATLVTDRESRALKGVITGRPC